MSDTYPELQHILQQQELVSDIALGMNTLEDFSVRVNRALQQTGEHTDVSRVYIFEDADDGAITNNTYEWCNRGIAPQIEELQGFPYDCAPSWKRMLIEEGSVYSEDIRQLPADLFAQLERQGIRSIIAYPLYVKQQFFGFIGFDECVRNKAWSRTELELLRTISGIIASSYERKQMEEALRCERDRANAANRAKSQFLAHMSHEIRSPMNIVLGYSEVLMEELPGEEQRNMARSIITGGRMLLSLLNDILDLSKIEAGRMEVAPAPVKPRPVLEELGLLFEQQAEKKGIAFSLSVSDTLPDMVVVDETRIRQVIFNLAGNAMKFTSQGEVRLQVDYFKKDPSSNRNNIFSSVNNDISSPVKGAMSVDPNAHPDPQPHRGDMSSPARGEMSVEEMSVNPNASNSPNQPPSNTLQIKISDTGIGIPPHEQEHIFEPFVQSAEVTDGGFGGTGLGLSICKRLVEQMGGSIEVASQAGDGSVFTVTIPCSEA